VGSGAGQWSDLDRPPLDEARLRSLLHVGGSDSWWKQLHVVDTTASTNADLLVAATDGAPEASVLVAEHQRAGRGRLGRGWEAPARSALTLSVLVRPDVPAARWPWLPLLAGVVTAEMVRSATDLDATVKWPNDVLVDVRKLAGVLVERVDTPAGPAAVLGIGINVTNTRVELPVPTATSLALEHARSTDRHVLLLELLRTLEAVYMAWVREHGDAAAGLHASYVRRCSTLGRRVRVELPGGTELTGRADSVDGTGRLVVATSTGRRPLGAGEVVHVRAAPI